MPKVSVIIPIYNTEKYLSKCLDSVCNQTLSNIEIICINDCSSDNSLALLKEKALKDNRIKIIDLKENKGAAHARNLGIDEAKGDFIAFLDSDDYPETFNFYEKLYTKATETNADITKGAYKNSDTGYVDEIINLKIKEDKNNFCATYCSAIFKTDFIKNNNIKFPPLMDMEDPVFAFECALKANKIEVIDDLYLIITKREDSITAGIPTTKQIQHKLNGLKRIYDLDKNCEHPHVLVFWLIIITNDLLRVNSFEMKKLLIQTCETIFRKLNLNDNFFEEYYKHNNTDHIVALLKSLIDKHEIISFDIFDTLLLRPFKDPTDVFSYIKNYTKTPHNFLNDRITAEKAARFFNQRTNKNYEDITYDEIYKHLNSKYPDFKELELDVEFQTLQKNNEMFEVYNYALKQNKKIIITSDMYLSSDFLTKVLNAKGYKGFYKLYVSSETKVCKGSGNMFKYILNDLNTEPNKILHIGDNLTSDYKSPKKLGLNAFYYPQVKTRFSQEHSGLDILLKHNYFAPENYWQNLAYNQGGELLNAFVQNIQKVVEERNLTDLFFIARDGYIIKKAYEILYPDSKTKTHYIYASRKLARLYENMPIEDANNEYTKYSKSINLKGDKIGIVDTCAGVFSAQNLVEKYWQGNSFIGIYLVAWLNYKFNYINLGFNTHTDNRLGFKWDLIETLFSSPEPPIEDIKNCRPIYRETLSEDDKFVCELYKDIEFGQLEYIKNINEITKKYNIETADVETIFKKLKYFWENLTNQDISMLSQIKHPVNDEQTKYLSLTSN